MSACGDWKLTDCWIEYNVSFTWVTTFSKWLVIICVVVVNFQWKLLLSFGMCFSENFHFRNMKTENYLWEGVGEAWILYYSFLSGGLSPTKLGQVKMCSEDENWKWFCVGGASCENWKLKVTLGEGAVGGLRTGEPVKSSHSLPVSDHRPLATP